MEIIFYYNQSDDRVIKKTLEGERTFVGELRGESNIMSPTIRFASQDVIRYNYCYIPEFRRYYYVSGITAISPNIYDIDMSVDVLMSFKLNILNLSCIIDRQSEEANFDEYIDDSSFVTENVMFTRVYEYPSGFNSTPTYILITAG